MSENIFAFGAAQPPQGEPYRQNVRVGRLPDYSKPPTGIGFTLVSVLMGFAIGFLIMYIYYKLILVAIIGGVFIGVLNIFLRRKNAVDKRKRLLRVQFLDMLEAMSVALRAGNPLAKALVSARDSLMITHTENNDIIVELNAIINKFANAIPLSEAFMDFAERSGLEDVASFATIYATIEGKSNRADEIVRETQKIIADKMTIEMEIETMMTSAKTEANIMLIMPLVILLVIGYAGAGFIDAIYTTPLGRVVATAGLAILIISYFLTQKYCKIHL